ncbi:MAG: AmmeMemoRadiSam system protein B [bacterium]
MNRLRRKNSFWLIIFLFFIPSCKTSKKGNESLAVKAPRLEHQAHLSEGWYSQNKSLLNHQINTYFELAQNNFYVEADPAAVKVLIVPHAGCFYSGLCAATAYQTLFENRNLYSRDLRNKHINKVIVVAPSHGKFFDGISIPDYTVYKTVLGDIKVDMNAWHNLARSAVFKTIPEAHTPEHAIEIQLPFLQKSIENFEIIPLVVGRIKDVDYEEICKKFKEIIDDKTLIVISSDFMHHGASYDYNMFDKNILHQVRYVDSIAYQAIMQKSYAAFNNVIEETRTTICGQDPIKIMLALLAEGIIGKGDFRLTNYYTSAHMAKARQQGELINIKTLLSSADDQDTGNSVSYLGAMYTTQDLSKLKKENQLTGYEQKVLVQLARSVIENEFKPADQKVPEHLLWPVLSEGVCKPAGAFVTIETKDGQLRGCIGQIASHRPLYETVMRMAKSAAFHDNRFAPLKKEELDKIAFEVTVLGAPERISDLHEIVLGRHGIILSKFANDGSLVTSSVFLPQVPTSFGWNLAQTLEQLSLKAGLGEEGWKEGCQFQVFEGVKIKEGEQNHS